MTSTLDPLTSFYGLDTSGYDHKARAEFSEFLNGNSKDFHVLGLTDSMGGGFDGTSYHFDTNFLRSFGREIARRTGCTWGGGAQLLGGDTHVPPRVQDNVHLSGSVFSQTLWIALTGTGTLTIDTDAGTVVKFVYLDQGSGYSVPWKVDGVAQTSIVMGNTLTLKVATSNTTLSNTTHTLEIDGVAGHSFAVTSYWCYDSSVKKFYTHTFSIGGSQANNGAAAANWSNTTSTGLGSVAISSFNLLTGNTAPDLLIVCAGANDISSGATPSNTQTGIQNMRNYYSGSPAWLIAEPCAFGASIPNTVTLIADIYSLGDSLLVPVFDLDNYWGNGSSGDGNATAFADGLLSSTDKTHPLQGTQESIGQHLAAAWLDAA